MVHRALAATSPAPRRPRRRWVAASLALWLVVAGSCAPERSAPAPGAGSDGPVPGPAVPAVPAGVRVVEVVDGDTLVVLAPGGEGRVRIIGINAPERDECLAGPATAALRRLVEGEVVDLVTDRSDRDRYGRLLRYVEVDGVDVGVAMVRDGFAVVRVSEPDTAREQVLRAAQDEARASGRGLWDPTACGLPPAGAEGVRVVRLRLDAEGDDNLNLSDEWVEVRNEGPAPADLTGWQIRDESASNRFDFPAGFTLGPGATVRIRSGCGTPTVSELFWCASGAAIWNNSGDTAFLLDPAGNVVHSLAG